MKTRFVKLKNVFPYIKMMEARGLYFCSRAEKTRKPNSVSFTYEKNETSQCDFIDASTTPTRFYIVT